MLMAVCTAQKLIPIKLPQDARTYLVRQAQMQHLACVAEPF
nr:hypothetical protein [uncultured Campylobacter sp.]